jgi:hypothetical protein
MKIKCPFCKTIYDPEAQDNTCPACNKKLLVTVFKKPAAKPEGAARSTVIKPAMPVVLSTANEQPGAKPAAAPEPAAPKAVIPEAPAASTVLVAEAPPPPLIKEKIVIPPPTPVVPVAPVVPPPPPAPAKPVIPVAPPQVKPAPAAPVEAAPCRAATGLDLVISIQKANAANWDTVIRIPVQVLKLANLVPARAREAIRAEGIDFDELRKAVEQTDHTGPLLDLRTPTERVLIAVDPHQ